LEETPVVKQKAGTVILNLINGWDEMRQVTGTNLAVPKWQLLEDLLSLLQRVYWHPKLSIELRGNSIEDKENGFNRQGSGNTFSTIDIDAQYRLNIVTVIAYSVQCV
jgi:hypothetical protein